MRTNKLFSFLALAAIVAIPAARAAGSDPVAPLDQKIRHELARLPYLNVFDELRYRVDDGTVTLSGAVTRPVIKADAEYAIRHVEGIARVDNQIEVLPLSSFDDQLRLRTYFSIYGYGPLERYSLGSQPPIRIIVKNGHITLAGVVATEGDKNLVFLRANGVPGAFSVSNELRVEGGLHAGGPSHS